MSFECSYSLHQSIHLFSERLISNDRIAPNFLILSRRGAVQISDLGLKSWAAVANRRSKKNALQRFDTVTPGTRRASKIMRASECIKQYIA